MKITAYTAGWCDIDRLDDIDLVDGERLRVTFPDKTKRSVVVKVVKSSWDISDHGHPCTIPVSKAFVVGDYFGVKIDVPIVGLEAKRT